MSVDVEIEHPHVHHHRAGHRLIDFAIPVAALFVSLLSIFIAWHHGKVMQELVHQNERLVQANSLPFMQIFSSNGDDYFKLVATNDGVGPAHIRSAVILIDGRPVKNLPELLDACCGPGPRSHMTQSTLQGLMLRPGERLEYLGLFSGSPDRERLESVFNAGRLETRLCYCSVFGDCWVRSSRDVALRLDPRPVKQCPKGPYNYRT